MNDERGEIEWQMDFPLKIGNEKYRIHLEADCFVLSRERGNWISFERRHLNQIMDFLEVESERIIGDPETVFHSKLRFGEGYYRVGKSSDGKLQIRSFSDGCFIPKMVFEFPMDHVTTLVENVQMCNERFDRFVEERE